MPRPLVGLALAGCAAVAAAQLLPPAQAGAGAPPASPTTFAAIVAALPATWQALPSAVTATEGALRSAKLSAAVAAWGDPARHCYAVALAAQVDGALEKVGEGLRAALAPAAPGAAPSASAGKPALSATLRWPMAGARPGLTLAHLRAEKNHTIVHAITCAFGNRAAARCQADCERLATALGAP